MTKSKIYIPLKKQHTHELIQGHLTTHGCCESHKYGQDKGLPYSMFLFEYLVVLAEVHNLFKT